MPRWLRILFGIDYLTLEEVILDFNHNNYDPYNPVIIKNKAKLKKQLKKKKISYKEYSKACTAMKSGWKYQDLRNIPPEEFSNKVITGSSFLQREPYTDMFPDGVVNCTLKNSNAQNCSIPNGFTLESTRNDQIKTQSDGEYWKVDKDLKPISPLSPKKYDEYGLSKDPKDLPTKPLKESIIDTAAREKAEQDRKDYIESVVNDPVKFKEILEKGELI